MTALHAGSLRKVYLIAYSKSDTQSFDRESFARAVARAFEAVATTFIIQWACCMEQHKDEGVLCTMLSKLQPWSMVKRYLHKVENVVVHFSGHAGYYTAYQYITEEDTEVLRSKNQQSTVAARQTLPAMQKCTVRARSRKKARAARKRLTNLEVSSIITSNGIDSELHLCPWQKRERQMVTAGCTSSYLTEAKKG